MGIVPSRNERPLSSAVGNVPACPLCAGGYEVPFPYEAAVFENRFPALRPDAEEPPTNQLFDAAVGRCEVVLYTSYHDASMRTLTGEELLRVIAIWADRSRELWADPAYEHVLIFENRGEAVGATIAHPHGQIYAVGHTPPLIATRVAALERFRREQGACWYCRCGNEPHADRREVSRTEGFVTEVPFAPRWPYETRIRARRHGLRRLSDMCQEEQGDLAVSLNRVTTAYDRLFDGPLPYMMVVHEAPDGADDWHLTVEFMPATRAPGVFKIRGSVETATGLFVNDVLPEDAADELRNLANATERIDLVEPFSVIAGPVDAPVAGLAALDEGHGS